MSAIVLICRCGRAGPLAGTVCGSSVFRSARAMQCPGRQSDGADFWHAPPPPWGGRGGGHARHGPGPLPHARHTWQYIGAEEARPLLKSTEPEAAEHVVRLSFTHSACVCVPVSGVDTPESGPPTGHYLPPPLNKKCPCIVGGGGEGTVTFTFRNLQKSSILSFSCMSVGWTR